MAKFRLNLVLSFLITLVFIQTISALNANNDPGAQQASSVNQDRHKRDFKAIWGMLDTLTTDPSHEMPNKTDEMESKTFIEALGEIGKDKEEEDGEEAEEAEETEEAEVDEDEEEEEDDDEEDGGFDECSPLEVIKAVNYSHFLPDDFEEVQKETIVKIVPRFDDTWGRFQRGFKWEHKLYANKDIKELFNYFVGMAYDMSYDFNLEPECAVAVTHLFKGLLNEEIWAFKFLDSQAHPLPTGFWGGIISSFGEYDQCLDLKSSHKDIDHVINGKYCMLKLVMPYPLTESYDPSFENNVFAAKVKNFTNKYGFGKYAEVNPILKITEYLNMRNGKFLEFGICIPDKCRPKDIEKEINRLIYPIFRIPVEINDTTCSVKDEKIHFDNFQLFSLSFFAITTILVLLSTVYELLNKYCNPNLDNDSDKVSQMNQILVSFSMIANTNKLLTERSGFSSVNTIKLLVCIWFVCAHTYFFTAHSFVLKRFNNSVPLQLFYENRYFFVRAKQLGVDSFMVASGLVLSYKLIGILEKSSGKFNYVNFILNRWFRLSVPLFSAILLYYIMPLVGSGPIWNECDGYFQPGCKDWSIIMSNFLYYSNINILMGKYFFGICVHMTWFLSSNFQLCLIAPALVITLHRYPKFGLTLNILLILSAVLLIMSPYFVFQLNTYYELTRLPSFKALTFSIFAYHMNTLQYVCSFAIGILTGYGIKNKSKLSLFGMSEHNSYRVLTVFALNIIPVMFVWNNMLNIYNDSPSELNAVLFFGLGKFLWSASLGWIWFVCCTGRAETLNKILSIDLIQPIAKLHYLMYLVHMPVIFYRIYSIRQTYLMTDWLTLQNIYIDLNITIGLSYILYILVVKPFDNLFRHIYADNGLGNGIRGHDLSQVLATNGQKTITTAESIFGSYKTANQFTESLDKNNINNNNSKL